MNLREKEFRLVFPSIVTAEGSDDEHRASETGTERTAAFTVRCGYGRHHDLPKKYREKDLF